MIEFFNPSGNTVFRVAGYKHSGERVRENFKFRAAAIARKLQLELEASYFSSTLAACFKATRLTDEQLRNAELAFTKLADRSLIHAVDFYLANYR